MENTKQPLLPPQQAISFGIPLRRNATRFMCFLICVGILTAAFALSGVWKTGEGWFGGNGALGQTDPTTEIQDTSPSDQMAGEDPPVSESIPDGAVPVISMDLSCDWNTGSFLQNQTAHQIDLSEIRAMPCVTKLKTEGPVMKKEEILWD